MHTWLFSPSRSFARTRWVHAIMLLLLFTLVCHCVYSVRLSFPGYCNSRQQCQQQQHRCCFGLLPSLVLSLPFGFRCYCFLWTRTLTIWEKPSTAINLLYNGLQPTHLCCQLTHSNATRTQAHYQIIHIHSNRSFAACITKTAATVAKYSSMDTFRFSRKLVKPYQLVILHIIRNALQCRHDHTCY